MMTPQIALTLTILGAAVILFISERLRMDLIALLVLAALALTGLVSPAEAFSGFSSPAVVTVWAVFILSGALSKTGVANLIGNQVLRFAGSGEIRLIALIMLTSGLLSSFMNNIGVAALLLPVVMDIARQTGHPPSKLLIPLAYSSLLGGLMTQIGTPPNIIISSALMEFGVPSFGMFDYTPIGVVIMGAGTLFMMFIGRHLLPERNPATMLKNSSIEQIIEFFELNKRIFLLRLPENSSLNGQTLADSRLGAILGLTVTAILRNGKTNLAPHPDDILQRGDRLVVTGRVDDLAEFQNHHPLQMSPTLNALEQIVSDTVDFSEIILGADFEHLGVTLQQADFRQRYGVMVLAVWRAEKIISGSVDNFPLISGDQLLVLGYRDKLDSLAQITGVKEQAVRPEQMAYINQHLITLNIPPESMLVGQTLAGSRLSELFGLAVLGIFGREQPRLLPVAEDCLHANDLIVVRGEADNLIALNDLQDLQISPDRELTIEQLESPRVGLVEAVLSPHTTLVGKTLRQLHFREKYGLNVLAIWRNGVSYRSRLRDMELRLGDALLLHGARQRLKMLASDSDFLVLAEEIQEEPRSKKMPVALVIMTAVLIPVILGWLPIQIAAVVGASLTVLTGCLTMDEAYRFIEWKVVFLVAGMLPLGLALEQTGTGTYIANLVLSLVGAWGPLAVVAALFVIATLASQVMPNSAVAVLLAPIALTTAQNFGVSPYPLMMTVAIASSASFLSPVAHASNLLILGPGGYRFSDYFRVGLPLTLVVMAIVLGLLPVLWPFY